MYGVPECSKEWVSGGNIGRAPGWFERLAGAKGPSANPLVLSCSEKKILGGIDGHSLRKSAQCAVNKLEEISCQIMSIGVYMPGK
jgi:hypothetical protein